MKFARIFAGLMLVSMLTGCAGRADSAAIPTNDTAPTSTEEEKKEDTSENDIKEEVYGDGTVRMEVAYMFDVVSLKPECITVGISLYHNGEDEYIYSGNMIEDPSKDIEDARAHFEPMLSCDDEGRAKLSSQDQDKIREILTQFYDDNMADLEEDVKDKYVEIANDPSMWRGTELSVDYSDEVKKDFVLMMNDEKIPIHADTCEIAFAIPDTTEDPPKDMAIKCIDGDSDDTSVFLWGFNLVYTGKMANEAAFVDPIREKYASSDKIDRESVGSSEDENDDIEDEETSANTGIFGRWYPEYEGTYIEFNEDGTGLMYGNGEEIPLTYTYEGNKIAVSFIPYPSSETLDFYYDDSDGTLCEEADGSIYSRKTTAQQQAEKDAKEPPTITDITGVWYDPTKLSSAIFTFNADGTGICDWGTNAKPAPFTYTVSNGTVTISMSRVTSTLKIRGDQLDDGDSRYVRR